jgi:hypothetical protein
VATLMAVLSAFFLRMAERCGARVEVRRQVQRDRYGRFLSDRPAPPGPAEELGLPARLNKISNIPFAGDDVEGEEYRRNLRRWG